MIKPTPNWRVFFNVGQHRASIDVIAPRGAQKAYVIETAKLNLVARQQQRHDVIEGVTEITQDQIHVGSLIEIDKDGKPARGARAQTGE